MRFIKLNGMRTCLNETKSDYVYLNADSIVYVRPDKKGAIIHTNEPEGESFHVRETPQEVMTKIMEAGYVNMFSTTEFKEADK